MHHDRERWTRVAARLALLCLALTSLPLNAATRCQLQAVELRDAGTFNEWLAIATDRPANFTSFKLSRPSRIVIDFPETIAPTLREEAPPAGPIARWTIDTLGAEERTVVRVMVELRDDADYTLTSTSTAVELRLVPATARPLAALENDAAPLPVGVVVATAPPAPPIPAPVLTVSTRPAPAAAAVTLPTPAVAVIPPTPVAVAVIPPTPVAVAPAPAVAVIPPTPVRVAARPAPVAVTLPSPAPATVAVTLPTPVPVNPTPVAATPPTPVALAARPAPVAVTLPMPAPAAVAATLPTPVAVAPAPAVAVIPPMPVAVDSPPPTPALLTDDSAREQARLEKQLVARHLAEQKAAWEATAKAERERVARERADRLRLQREQAETARQDAIASAAKEKAAREQAEQDRQVKAAQARREARERVAAERTRRLAEHKARAERAKQAHDEAVAQARADREARTARLRADKETKEAAWRASHATRPANLVRLAFHRTETETQLALHLSAPVVYAVRQSQPDKLMLDLEHTQIALPNNRRELDTHFFGTAVTRIIPHEDKAHARVTIEMQLASSVPYEVKTDGSTLTVVFHALPEAGMIAAP